MKSVGFKEWALVCAALGSGAQSIILRKGGIAEGRAGFSFQEREFFLFPTFFHEQVMKTRLPNATLPEPRAGEIELRFWARLEWAAIISHWETAAALEPYHILQPAVVRERFKYDAAPGIHVGFVRVFRLMPAWIIPARPSYGGCRSWVQLPDWPEGHALEPVLPEAEHQQRLEEVRAMTAAARCR